MKTIIEQAQSYLAACPPAVTGFSGHNTAFHIINEILNGFGLSKSDTLTAIYDWNLRCQPPWSDGELNHKIEAAESSNYDKPKGWRASGNNRQNIIQKTAKITENPTIALLKAAFLEGEGISISIAVEGKDNRTVPASKGLVLSREEWITKIEANGGDANKIWSGDLGGFIRINPIKALGSTDADVTAYRHALLEFDTIASVDEQYRIITESNVPCSAVLFSGGKSVHAWVKVDAKDRIDYATKVKELYTHFAQHKPDEKNRNPSRFSRLAGLRRGEKMQDLLAIDIGSESWSMWKAKLATAGCEVMRVSDLLKIDTENDPNSVLGKRWLCKGHAAVIMGPSGVGKSTITMQLAVNWAIGKAVFGIIPKGPLRHLIIQAENDAGDLSEQLKATLKSMPKFNTPEIIAILNKQLIFVRESVATGFNFVQKLQTLIDYHKPDVVWVDPLLSYIGDDLSAQKVASTFLRNWLAPVLEATGVVLFVVHHIRKPSKEDSTRSESYLQYLASGSSDLVNWARAIIYLEAVEDAFCLRLLKRGKRAGARNHNGDLTDKVWMKHSAEGPTWETCPTPDVPIVKPTEYKSKALSMVRKASNNIKIPTTAKVMEALSEPFNYFDSIDRIATHCSCTETEAKLAFAVAKSLLQRDMTGKFPTYVNPNKKNQIDI